MKKQCNIKLSLVLVIFINSQDSSLSMDKRRQALLDYIKEAFKRGYSEIQLRRSLLEHGIAGIEAASLLKEAKKEVAPVAVEEAVPGKTKHRLPALLIAIAGIVVAVVVYLYRFVSPGNLNFEELGSLNTVWPLAFPILANIINLIFFRKRFLFDLIITLVVLILLLGLILLLTFFGI